MGVAQSGVGKVSEYDANDEKLINLNDDVFEEVRVCVCVCKDARMCVCVCVCSCVVCLYVLAFVCTSKLWCVCVCFVCIHALCDLCVCVYVCVCVHICKTARVVCLTSACVCVCVCVCVRAMISIPSLSTVPGTNSFRT